MRNSIFKRLVRSVTHNLGLKLLAVIVSCGLWFVVNTITDPMDRKIFNNIPVEIINEETITSDGKVYEILDGTDSVNVTVTGKSSILTDLTRDEIKAVADMSKLTFMNTVGIEVSSTRNNSELDFNKSIGNLKLSIENRKIVQKSIIAATSGEAAAGYIVERADASPNVVRFSGPESLINQIDRVEAVTNIDGYSSNITTSVELKIYDAGNNELKSNSIKMNVYTVNVSVSILATKEVPLGFTVSGTPAEGYVVSDPILSDPETVVLAARSNVLDGISKLTIADPGLSVEGLTSNMTSVVNIKKYLPNGVQLADGDFSGNVGVAVGIEKLATRDLTIPSGNFATNNNPEGFKVTLKEKEDAENYKIRIEGTKAAVDVVRADGVIGVVDMNAIKEKLGITEWAAGTYYGEIIFNLPGNVKLAQSYAMTVVVENINDGIE